MKCRGARLLSFLILFAALMLSSFCAVSWATDARIANKTAEGQVSRDLEFFDLWRKSLTEERQILERQAERQYDAFEKLLDKTMWIFGIIATVVFGSLVWLFGQSRKDFKKTINETFKKQAQEIVENEAVQLRQRYENLKAEVEDLSAYKRRQVTWVAKPDFNSSEALLKALHVMGIQNVGFLTPEAGKEFDLGDPDLVILTFDGTDEARHLLSGIVDRLKQQSPPVPLLIYTFSSGRTQVRLDDADLTILDGFEWHVPVNFPAQLLAQTQLLIRRSRGVLGGSHGKL